MCASNVCVLAIDAGGTFLKAALVRSDFTILQDSFLRVSVDSKGDADGIRTAYIQLAAQALQKAREYHLTITAVGICIPGPFDYQNGISLMTHKYAAIKGIPMRPWIQEGVGDVPVRFIHDSHAFLLGAVRNSSCNGFERVAGVTIGTGLGFASMFDGKINANAQGGPAISIFGRPYRSGISEDYVSRRAVLARYNEISGNVVKGLDVIDIARLAQQGQPDAVSVFSEMGSCLAEILYDILKNNRFEYLVLGGAISKSVALFLPQLKIGLSDLPALRYIEAAQDIDIAPVLGAAQVAFAE